MDNLDFSEEEIQEQLAVLGYKNIPQHRLREFKRDLDELIQHGEWKTLAPSTQRNSTVSPTAPSVSIYLMFNILLKIYLIRYTFCDTQVLTTCQNRDYRWQQGRCDLYARHSVAPKLQMPPGGPGRLQVEPDPEDSLHPLLTDSCTSSPDTQGRRFIKRKVLRKYKGQSLVCDESVYSENSDAVSCMEERLAELHLSTSDQHDSEMESEDVTSQSETPSSSADGISLSAFESYIRGMTQTQSAGAFRPKPKSFIRPVMSQQTIKKTDPVNRYFQYKQLWDMFKLPGEKDRRALRQEIKEQLAYQPPPPKPRRVYVPNTYVVPTEKKRSALRWEVRNDLANGLLPHKFSYRF
uniref:HYLS1 centriolar and ciliogenesis associated n=1 Tax=Mastacembelus armatus TaxID=205130 RepID=A0A3Q3KYT9_9TELE